MHGLTQQVTAMHRYTVHCSLCTHFPFYVFLLKEIFNNILMFYFVGMHGLLFDCQKRLAHFNEWIIWKRSRNRLLDEKKFYARCIHLLSNRCIAFHIYRQILLNNSLSNSIPWILDFGFLEIICMHSTLFVFSRPNKTLFSSFCLLHQEHSECMGSKRNELRR